MAARWPWAVRRSPRQSAASTFSAAFERRCTCVHEFENNYVTAMCSGSEAGSCLRLIDFVSRNSRCGFDSRWGAGSSCGAQSAASTFSAAFDRRCTWQR